MCPGSAWPRRSRSPGWPGRADTAPLTAVARVRAALSRPEIPVVHRIDHLVDKISVMATARQVLAGRFPYLDSRFRRSPAGRRSCPPRRWPTRCAARRPGGTGRRDGERRPWRFRDAVPVRRPPGRTRPAVRCLTGPRTARRLRNGSVLLQWLIPGSPNRDSGLPGGDAPPKPRRAREPVSGRPGRARHRHGRTCGRRRPG